MKMKNALLTRLLLIPIFIFAGVTFSRAESSYTVKQGDSLYTIAKKFNITVRELQEINQLSDSKIKVGQRLLIPARSVTGQVSAPKKEKERSSVWEDDLEEGDIPETHIVKKGETLKQIARRYQLAMEDLKEINQLSGEKLKVGQILYLQRPYHSEKEKGREEEQREFRRVSGLGFLVTDKDRDLLVRAAKSFLGLRYARGGTSINGMDCSALVQRIFQIFGIELPRTTREQFQVGYAVPRNSLRRGDLVFFKRGKFPQPAHVGIYIGNNQFIHTSLKKGRVEIDSLDNYYFASRFIGARRIEEEIGIEGEKNIVHVHISNPWE